MLRTWFEQSPGLTLRWEISWHKNDVYDTIFRGLLFRSLIVQKMYFNQIKVYLCRTTHLTSIPACALCARRAWTTSTIACTRPIWQPVGICQLVSPCRSRAFLLGHGTYSSSSSYARRNGLDSETSKVPFILFRTSITAWILSENGVPADVDLWYVRFDRTCRSKSGALLLYCQGIARVESQTTAATRRQSYIWPVRLYLSWSHDAVC